jgi:hypothetical protein
MQQPMNKLAAFEVTGPTGTVASIDERGTVTCAKVTFKDGTSLVSAPASSDEEQNLDAGTF